MEAGYIYILVNDSLPGLIKIGITSLGAKQRAKQLSNNTAVPTPYIVAYEKYIDNYKHFESTLHNILSAYRVNTNREFFKYPVNDAIDLIQRLTNNADEGEFEAVEILPQLLTKYNKFIDSRIVSARICQDGERVYFEFTKEELIADYLKNQIITRQDLGFIVNDIDDSTFPPNCNLDYNIKQFMDFDDIGMAHCFSEIFTDDWYMFKKVT